MRRFFNKRRLTVTGGEWFPIPSCEARVFSRRPDRIPPGDAGIRRRRKRSGDTEHVVDSV